MKEKKISEIIPAVLNNINKTQPCEKRDIFIDWEKIWAQICGEARAYSYVLKISDDTLVVAVKNSAWIMELKKREKELLKTIYETTGIRLKKIRFVH